MLYVKQMNKYLISQFFGAIFTPKNPISVDKKKNLSLSVLSTKIYVRTKKIEEEHLPSVPCK